MADNKALTVYKASAGSGKTFKLALEFIKLLMINPHKYENILAVTFTNKATEEMKHRIVSQLYGLSHSLKSSDSYMDAIVEELGMTREAVAEKATIALHNLLHNYSMFRVQTIDSFFQTVLRNMAKELGLGNNMRISINYEYLLDRSVDNMFEHLSRDKKLMSWVMQYIYEHMDSSDSWKIATSIKSFGKNLQKEFFKRNEKLLETIAADEMFFDDYKNMLQNILADAEKRYKEEADKFFDALEKAHFTVDDLSNKTSGAAGYFVKMRNGNFGQEKEDILNKTALAACTEPSKWYRKKARVELEDLAKNTLTPLIASVEAKRSKERRALRSAKITLENINNMRILFSIRKEMEELNKANSQFMLGDTQTLLSGMIDAEHHDAPFIFEKIGAYLEHIMIDEFQDTSAVQWHNFKVLLDECMSSAGEETTEGGKLINNLLVGDVKQSIYRFRNGDWRLLNGINDEFDDESLNIVPLDTNWRSDRNIIDFNNAFFKHASRIVADGIMPEEYEACEAIREAEKLSTALMDDRRMYAQDIRNAYNDVCQLVPGKRKKEGFVKIQFLPTSNKEDFQKEVLQRCLDYTRSLVSQGAKLSDIAILVRGNDEAKTLANYFADNAPNLHIVSDDAFNLEASPLVMMLVNGIKYVHGVEPIQSSNALLKYYTEFILKADGASPAREFSDKDAFEQLMPQELVVKEKVEKLRFLAFDELVERLFCILSLDTLTGQHSYASTFFDKIAAFTRDNGSMVQQFIDYWDEELHKKSIKIGTKDCIRVITIHKSKGLEYKHVIMPFANWRIIPKGSEVLWCMTDEEPYNSLPFIPVNYTSKDSLACSIYERYGLEEWMQETVDHLNLLYVAFTRAKRSLYVIADQKPVASTRTKLLIDTVKALVENGELEDVKISGENGLENHKEVYELCFGVNHFDEEDDDEEKRTNIFEAEPEPLRYEVKSFDNSAIAFRQSNKSREFENDTLDDKDAHRFTTMGSIMHMLFSQIRTLDDVEKTLRQFEFDGVIYNDDVTAEELRNKLREKFRNPKVRDWFSDEWTVFNECNIMRIEGGRIVEERPDRVITNGQQTIVIDYKFGKRNKDYHTQVESYMSLMREMNYPDVKGYIWYVNEDDGVVEV